MAEIDPQLVKQLREKTNAGMMDCKRALTEADGDLEKAEALLAPRASPAPGKKASRATKEGIVASYIHLQGKVGVLVEINCETDFVAKNENFRDFVKDITLHIAAAHPRLRQPRGSAGEDGRFERARFTEGQVKGKPENIDGQIVERKARQILSARFACSIRALSRTRIRRSRNWCDARLPSSARISSSAVLRATRSASPWVARFPLRLRLKNPPRRLRLGI